MAVQHPNFYENLAEAQLRLLNTLVMYDGEPYQILAITNHKPDGVFRVYLDPINIDPEAKRHSIVLVTGIIHSTDVTLGPALDGWLENNKDSGVLRKHMSSPHFNKFRPFSLGMCNYDSKTYYLERQPQRPSTKQGLTASMISEDAISLLNKGKPNNHLYSVQIYSKAFYACVRGQHPSAQECLTVLKDVEGYENEAGAFHRLFALVRGPIGTIFLAYKGDIVGILPKQDLSEVRLGKRYTHTKEVIEELRLFNTISQA